MRVLVCGGRDYADRETVRTELSRLDHDRGPITVLLHGACRGADLLAADWAMMVNDVRPSARIEVKAYPADWNLHGRAAGPIRNDWMLRDGRPDVVLAFEGGRGTADMVRRAKAAGVEVIEVTP